MAIIKENININGRAFTKTYSNEYRYIVRDGVSYISAIDPSEFNREYVEGELIDIIEDDYEIVGRILTGANREDEYDYSNEEEVANYEAMCREYMEIGKMFLGVDEDDNN